LSKAAEAYFTGYLYSNEYYPAINAASLYLILGNKDKAHQIAKEVIVQIKNPRDYWATSTLGEANLLLENPKEAITYFNSAIQISPKQFGKFQSTYKQLVFLQDAIDIPQQLMELFPKPNLAVFSGHMIDDPERSSQRFPQEIEEQVRIELKRKVEELDVDIGFTSLASGGDILFIEILIGRGAEIKAYLPFNKEDFISTSVANAGMGWIKRFENCYDCTPKYLTSEPYLDTPDLFRHLGKVMIGESILLSEQYGITPYLVTIQAPFQTKLKGGTRDFADSWPYPEMHHNIDPTQFLKDKIKTAIKKEKPVALEKQKKEVTRKISNILFADIVGFSKLLEKDTPGVILRLLTEIRKLIDPYLKDVEVINTWGDAIIICHPEEHTIMKIATAIQGVFVGAKAKALNLPEGLNIRIALHKGPVFFAIDPLTGEANVYGSTINRTARMEPVTLPGSIYASDQFAACLKLDAKDTYLYQHVGIIELPKKFGKQEVYHVSQK
jgi:class 3 adenylate cyclase/tetratricopeptide (TPR) repeat protein